MLSIQISSMDFLLIRLSFVLLSAFFGDVLTVHVQANEDIAATVTSKSYWRIGIVVRTENGPCKGVFVSTPVPTDWPEQSVRIVQRDVSENVNRLQFRQLSGGVRQMVIDIPRLRAGQTASALLTFEVEKLALPSLSDWTHRSKPTRPSRHLLRYLRPSPLIESRNPEIISRSKSIGNRRQSDGERVEAIYDWVRENVRYEEGDLKGALAALEDRCGDCEELSSLFIALCRAQGIPSRTVWVPGHCYPEFFLKRNGAQGDWIPCQVAGDRAFGEMNESRPILQKGDSFHVPGDSQKRPLRYAQIVGSLPSEGFIHPRVEIVHELISIDGVIAN